MQIMKESNKSIYTFWWCKSWRGGENTYHDKIKILKLSNDYDESC